MNKKTYQVIEPSSILNIDREEVGTLNVGDEVSGEFVLVSDEPYVETPEGYISTKGLAEKLETPSTIDTTTTVTESKVKSSHKKMIFALVGAGVGYSIAHFAMKADTKKKVIFTLGGMALGLLAEFVNNRKK